MNNIKLMIDGINCSSVIINPNAIDQYYDNSNSKNISSNNIQNVIEEIDSHISNIKIDIENNKEYVDNKISNLIGTVPETLDTLEEISNVITNNSDTITILNEAIGNKANKVHNHTISDITNFPTSLPASDVYSWAKASTKPKYTYNEVGADASGSAATALTNANAYTNTKINELNKTMNSVDQSRGFLTNGADIEKLSNGTYQITPTSHPSCGIPAGLNDYGSITISGSNQYPHIEYVDLFGYSAKWDYMNKAWRITEHKLDGGASLVAHDNFNPSIIPVTNENGKIVSSTIPVSYLYGLRGNIQDQIDNFGKHLDLIMNHWVETTGGGYVTSDVVSSYIQNYPFLYIRLIYGGEEEARVFIPTALLMNSTTYDTAIRLVTNLTRNAGSDKMGAELIYNDTEGRIQGFVNEAYLVVHVYGVR